MQIRFMHAAAREGHLPSFLSCINEPSSSPRAALVGQLVCTFAISFVDIDTLINYVTFVMWGQRAVTVAALLYLRYKKMPVAEGSIKIPIVCTSLFFIISVALVVVPFVEEPVITSMGVIFVFSGLIFYIILVKPEKTPLILQKVNEGMTRMTCRILFTQVDLKKGVNETVKHKDELKSLDSPTLQE